MSANHSFEKYRQDFPILQQKIHGKPLVYLDSAASSQKPKVVIDAVHQYYSEYHANVHRGVHTLSARATEMYEQTRLAVKNYVNAQHTEEIIFVRGATEGINLVAQSYGRAFLKPGDEILVSIMEHHSNIVPWQLLCEQIGTVLRVIPMTPTGELDIEAYQQLLTPRTRLVAIAHVSNVLGTINPIHDIIKSAHEHGAHVLVDGAQAVSHLPVDVQALDCDFYVFSSHKIYGPTGVGVLYGKKAWLERMPPYQGGGEMVAEVTFARTTYQALPHKFEAGTPSLASVAGLQAALQYLQTIGIENIKQHEATLTAYALEKFQQWPEIQVIGKAKNRRGIISFTMAEIHPHDIGTILDHAGIALRAGHHCAMPLMEHLGLPGTARISFGLYNTLSEIDALMAGITETKRVFT